MTLHAIIQALVADVVDRRRRLQLARQMVRMRERRATQLRITGSYPVTDRAGRIVCVMHARAK